jgi:hypothetical protein
MAITLRRTIHLAIGLLAAALLVAPGAVSAEPEGSAQDWADAGSATIHPGVQAFIGNAQCTTNFIFADETSVFIGLAAHCASLGGATATDGCQASTRPTGTPVEIDGATRPGTMVYNSWETMGEVGETDPNACAFNDFALVEIDPADHGRVNPSVPHWGGPQGITTSTSFGERVFTYGNSSLRFGVTVLSPKEGVSLGQSGDGWTHTVYTVTPGIPGDSGSPFLASDGSAFGVVSTLHILPTAGANGVTDVSRALDYLRTHAPGFAGVDLVDGTEPFAAGLLLGLLR